METPDPRAHEERERDVADGVEGEIEDVGDRRDRDGLEPREVELVVEVAGRPEQHSAAQQQPLETLGAHDDSSAQAKDA